MLFQWPADLLTHCAVEMEVLMLGWYILVETQSVMLLTVFASLVPPERLMTAMGAAGTTSDCSRIVGPLAGAAVWPLTADGNTRR